MTTRSGRVSRGNNNLREFLAAPENKVNFVRFINPADKYFGRDGIVYGVTKTGTRLKLHLVTNLGINVTRHPRNVRLTPDISALSKRILAEEHAEQLRRAGLVN